MFNFGNGMNGCDGFDQSMLMMAILMNGMMPNMNVGGNNMNMNNMNMNNMDMNNMNMFGNNNMNMFGNNNMNMFGNNNMGMFGNNNMNNMNMFNFNNANNTSNFQPIQGKVNVVFVTTNGVKSNMVVDYGTTIKNMIELYLLRVDRKNLIGSKEIYFLHNAKYLDINDSRKVESEFNPGENRVLVNDAHNLIGA